MTTRLTGFAAAILLFVPPLHPAPYTTPNTGVRWNLDSLVVYSAGTLNGAFPDYQLTDLITISANDHLEAPPGSTVTVAAGSTIGFTVFGSLRMAGTAADSIVVKGASPSAGSYRGIRIEDSAADSACVFRRVHLRDASEAIHCLGASPVIEECSFTNNGSNAIRLFGASPLVRACTFYGNRRSAVTVNSGSSPLIEGCRFINNNTENTSPRNTISVGPQGANNPVIRNNLIENGPYDRTGAISLTSLFADASCAALVEGNILRQNSFGILSQGLNISARIRYNRIEENSINPDPMISGSGISIQLGGVTNAPVITGNLFRRNLWGVTIVSGGVPANSPQPSLGNTGNADTSDDGWNVFVENGNGGAIHQVYNNASALIAAQNNYWGSADSAVIESWITHRADSVQFGEVLYRPFGDRGLGIPLAFSVSQATEQSVRLSWRFAAVGEGSIRIMAGTDSSSLETVGILPGQDTAVVVQAPFGMPYTYGLSSFNRFGESDSVIRTYTIRDLTPPGLPQGLELSRSILPSPAPFQALIDVRWRRNPEPDVAAYRLERAVRDSSTRLLRTVIPSSDTLWTDTTGCDTLYHYWLSAVDTAGNVGPALWTTFAWPCPLAVEEQPNAPREFALHQNRPNPFNPETEIAFELPERSWATLKVFDVLGGEVATLMEGSFPAGMHRTTWNATGRPSGMYFYRLSTPSFTAVRKMILTK